MTTGTVYTGDLLHLLRELPAAEHAAAADAAGFVPVVGEGEAGAASGDALTVELRGRDQASPGSSSAPPAPSRAAEQMLFWRVEADYTDTQASIEVPGWLQEPPKAGAEAFVSPPGSGPEEPALVEPERFARFIGSVIASRLEGREPDIPRAVRRLAAAQALQPLPALTRRHWPRQLTLVLDLSPSLCPFRRDLLRLAGQLCRQLGQRVRLVATEAGEPGRWISAPGLVTAVPADGCTVVVLGDAGLYRSGAGLAQRWADWAMTLGRAGTRPLLLAPVPAALVSAATLDHFDTCLIDQAQPLHLLRRDAATGGEAGEPAQQARRRAGLALLRCALFGNSHVTWALLRQLRRALQAAGEPVDIGSEYELAQDEGVHDTLTACALMPDHVEPARAAWLEFRRSQPAVADELLRLHLTWLAHGSPLVRAIFLQEHQQPDLLPADPTLRQALEREATAAQALLADAARHQWAHRADSAVAAPQLATALKGFIGDLPLRAGEVVGRGSDALQAAWALAHADALQDGRAVLPAGLRLDRLQWLVPSQGEGGTRARLYAATLSKPGGLPARVQFELRHVKSEAAPDTSLAEFESVRYLTVTRRCDGQDALRLAIGWALDLLQDVIARRAEFPRYVIESDPDLESRCVLAGNFLKWVFAPFWESLPDEDDELLRLIYRVGTFFEQDQPREERIDFLRIQCLAIGARQGLLGANREEAARRLSRAFLQVFPSDWCSRHGVSPDLFSTAVHQLQVGATIELAGSGRFNFEVGPRRVEVLGFQRPSWSDRLVYESGAWRTGERLTWISGRDFHLLDSEDGKYFRLPVGAWRQVSDEYPISPYRGVMGPPDWASRHGVDEYGYWAEFEIPARSGPVTQRLRWIPRGEFWMGSPEAEAERTEGGEYGETLHRVLLSQGFWLADTACTQALWRAVLGENPSYFQGYPANPVEQVSWNDVIEKFLPALNRLVPGLEAMLPSEAQWEYASRAGSEAPFWFGEQITPEQVNFDGNNPHAGSDEAEYRGMTVPVKSLPANGWGLYEMHGNVYEWCEDVLSEYPKVGWADSRKPQDGAGGRQRVLRGGCWNDLGWNCRSASRSASVPDVRGDRVGFRLARGMGVSPPVGASNKPDLEMEALRVHVTRSMEILEGGKRKPANLAPTRKGRGGRSASKK